MYSKLFYAEKCDELFVHLENDVPHVQYNRYNSIVVSSERD
jgi:hypothetical protein